MEGRKTNRYLKGALLLGALALLLALVCVVLLVGNNRPLPYEPLDMPVTEAEIVARGPLSEQRRTVVESALSLVGKVPYFWGGKSEAIGMDPLWNTPAIVESAGSETTGTVRPLGLDCSGYVSWCFSQNGLTFSEMKRTVGNGTMNQWKLSYPVTWDTLLVGDLVFQHDPEEGLGNHVGIVVGFHENGEPLIAHCAASFNNVVITGRGEVFQHPRRPYFYED